MIVLSLLLLGIYSNNNTLTYAAGQTCSPQNSSIARSTGLISARDFGLSNLFGTTEGKCITGGVEAGISNISTYSDLKTEYYDNAKSITGKVNKNLAINSNATQANIPLNGSVDQLYYINGNLTLSGVPAGGKSGVIFVSQDLEFVNDYAYNLITAGTIFVVKGNVYIAPAVSRIDAVIIAEGTIYTASSSGSTCSSAAVTTTSALNINGSLVSVGSSPIKFCRKLANNYNPAEIIAVQPKYLPLFRDLFASDFTARVEDQMIGSYQGLAPSAPPPVLLYVTCEPSVSSVSSGAPFEWRATVLGGSGTYNSYQWLLDASGTTKNVSASYVVPSTTIKNAQVRVTDSTGAIATSSTCSVVINKSINPIDIGPTQDINSLLDI